MSLISIRSGFEWCGRMNRGVVYGVVASLLLFKLQLPVWAVALLLLALYAAMGGWKFLSVMARTCRRDFT